MIGGLTLCSVVELWAERFDTSLAGLGIFRAILMAQRKTAVTPLQTHWSYCSLALSHRYRSVPYVLMLWFLHSADIVLPLYIYSCWVSPTYISHSYSRSRLNGNTTRCCDHHSLLAIHWDRQSVPEDGAKSDGMVNCGRGKYVGQRETRWTLEPVLLLKKHRESQNLIEHSEFHIPVWTWYFHGNKITNKCLRWWLMSGMMKIILIMITTLWRIWYHFFIVIISMIMMLLVIIKIIICDHGNSI